VAGALGKRANRTLVDDLANNASVAAITATEQAESEEKLAAWLDGVARITVKVHFGELKQERELLQRFADAGGPVVVYDDGDDEKWLLGKWLKEQVADTPHEKEVYEVIVAKAKSKKTYEQLAEERGLPIRAIHGRVARLKEKYRPLWEQHRRDRNRFVLFRLFPGVAAAVLAIAAILWALFGPRPAPVPAVKEPLPVPSASASAPPPEPFMPAQPTKPPTSPRTPTVDPDGKR
jgi:DNA-directed RNA polymerase specialized sigma24 family protein